MPLQPGTRLGTYEILAALGAGGMGEVYRARDTQLNRDVAVKILPAVFASDPERLARFTREAQTLAALNHPQISHVYGLDRHGDTSFIVMELVEGEDLAQRIARGPVPFDEAMPIARQIAEAVEAAHEQGIVHRDLKPANIKVRPDGTVKVLDFGLAKALQIGGEEAAGLANSPTITNHPMTGQGVILGTAAYMSPEQARGKVVDKRADIWAFGCVLYEMLTGRAAFSGATFTDTAAAILERNPDWQALPPGTPPSIRNLLQRCVEKDPKQRLRDIGDARIALTRRDEMPAISDTGRQVPARWSRRTQAVAAAGLVALVSASIAVGFLRPRSAAARAATSVRFLVAPPEGGTFAREIPNAFLALSPDGSQLAFVAATPNTRSRIWVRRMSELDARALPGTEGGRSPFWSPDGGSLAFFIDDQLKRISPSGGAAVPVCDIKDAGRSHGTWGSEGTILISASDGTAILSVPAAGGTPEPILTPDRSKGEVRVNWPWFLPDGERFLYLTRMADGNGQVRLLKRGGSPRTLFSAVSSVQWVDPDYLVFARDGVLVGQRFDLVSERLVGEPFSIAEPVDYHFTIARAMFASSRSGAIAYHSHSDVSRLVWSDRSGREIGTLGKPGGYQNLRLSPDGATVLFDRATPGSGSWDLWTVDLARGVETRVTSDRGSEVTGVWLPDGHGIVFGADRGGPPRLFRRDLATRVEAELLPSPRRQQQAQDVTPDGKALIFLERTVMGNFDAFTLPLDGPATPQPLLTSRFFSTDVRVSRDGKAMAFVSNETGRFEVYIAPFGGKGRRITVSGGGGSWPRWSRDGRELFYVTADRHVMAVPVRTTPSLEVGTPSTLFVLPERAVWSDFDVSLDGRRFLAVVPEVRPAALPVTVVLNWTADVRR